ncbi:MAG: hypothetical protein RLZZ47_337 [Bacteroidota bacterium]|jgi:LPS export ABC transporter protein LptC
MMRWGSLIALVVTALMACSDAGKSTYIKKKKDTFASNEYAEKVTIEYTDSGRLRARVFSPILTAVKSKRNPYLLMKKGLKVDFYDNKGALESYMTAEYGISYMEDKRVVVRRNVEILNIKGETLNTEELIWDQKTGTIRTDKFVKITGEDQITTGTGLISNQSFTDWEIINYAGTINLPNDKKPHPRPLISGRGRY